MDSPMRQTTLEIDGMSCEGCVTSVRETLERLQGTWPREVRIGGATVAFDPGRIDVKRIIEALSRAGYRARVTERDPEDAGAETG